MRNNERIVLRHLQSWICVISKTTGSQIIFPSVFNIKGGSSVCRRLIEGAGTSIYSWDPEDIREDVFNLKYMWTIYANNLNKFN